MGVSSLRDSFEGPVTRKSMVRRTGYFLGLDGKELQTDARDAEDFESLFAPNEMRLLALVSHNNMKDAMREFVIQNKHVLKKFRLTGTNSTMTMLREVLKDEIDVMYGPTCTSGPLGGDAQLVALAVTG